MPPGNCKLMCPYAEIEMRERERLLHPLEILKGTEKLKYPKADNFRVIKCFSRSAAGVDLASPDLLRPTPILIKTVYYLLSEVVNDSRFSEVCKYDFIVDRLRAVQQDMIIQTLPSEDCIQILEPIVKFHSLYGYKLYFENISVYDPVLNRKHLLEYLKRLLVCYDDLDMTNLNDCFMNLRISDEPKRYSVDRRILIESIYIACNLGDSHPLDRYLKLPKHFKNGYLKTCFEMSLCYISRNWVRLCRLMKKLPLIIMCCAVLSLPDIRKSAFQVMSCAYHSKTLKYPVDNLSHLLLYNKEEELLKECQYYNLQVVDNKFIAFNKDDFQNNKSFPFSHVSFLDEQLNKTQSPLTIC